ncbi:MAG: zinc-ribbon domain-containing protein [Deltaproteobacteria bacterium]|nr:zinc-ribbon domain-containing protein [Deltaproteobacteria bacterium]
MRIACSRCETRYDLPDEKLDRGPVKIRCSRCSHVFVVKRRAEPAAPEPPPQPPAQFEDFDFATFESPQRPAPPAPEAPAPLSLDDFDLSTFDATARPPTPEPTAPAPGPASFGDFDFGSFETPTTAGAEPAAPGEEPESSLFDDELPALGELDLGEFDDGAEGFGADEDAGAPHALRPYEGEGETESVKPEDLVSAAGGSRRSPGQGLAEDAPRLDLQKGPRRTDAAGQPSRVVARDRGRSPFLWAVAVVALGTAAFTGYNVYRYPDKAFSLLNLNWVREIWRNRETETRFVTEDVRGYAQTLPGGRRAFLIRGTIVNHSTTPQGLVRVRGNLFAADGSKLASSEVYCGNVLSDQELATLPRASIEARLQNQVGEALSNVDIAPGGKVPFMVVFLSPAARVEKFNVQVTASRAGSGA